MNSQFISAIEQICDEKGLTKEIVLEAIEAALAAAYKKDYGDRDQEVRVTLDEVSGEPRIFVSKEVVEDVENPFLQISVADAQKYKKGAK
jgi:N utilization substance protein A